MVSVVAMKGFSARCLCWSRAPQSVDASLGTYRIGQALRFIRAEPNLQRRAGDLKWLSTADLQAYPLLGRISRHGVCAAASAEHARAACSAERLVKRAR